MNSYLGKSGTTFLLKAIFLLVPLFVEAQDSLRTFQKMDGYKGIWFELGQKTEYGDKYSGGLGTYTAKHSPLAIYSKEKHRTYFVYGGTINAETRHLLCMISYYDHKKKQLARPVVVMDKKGIKDPHDNPSLLIDPQGYIWVFVSGRGRGRSGFKFKSEKPWEIDAFEEVAKKEMTYPQPWYVEGKGYFHFFTKYTGLRELYFERSNDGLAWTEDQPLAAIKRLEDAHSGHYQVSGSYGGKVVTFFNWHPNGDVDKRTNLYYLESHDFGNTWQTVDGQKVDLPVRDPMHPCLVDEYYSWAQNVYLKDMNFDKHGNPIALFLVSNGHQPGPDNGMRVWKTARWNGQRWEINEVCHSDHNYDMGSLFISGNKWKVIAPTAAGAQAWGTGGDVELWQSTDEGKSWKKKKSITSQSEYNHAYVRRPLHAHKHFYAFWADGHANEFSPSRLFYMNKKGKYTMMPYED